MSIIDAVKGWVLKIALQKGLQNGIKALVGVALAKLATAPLEQYGVKLDVNADQLQAGLIVLAISGLEVARNWLKVKFGIKWL